MPYVVISETISSYTNCPSPAEEVNDTRKVHNHILWHKNKNVFKDTFNEMCSDVRLSANYVTAMCLIWKKNFLKRTQLIDQPSSTFLPAPSPPSPPNIPSQGWKMAGNRLRLDRQDCLTTKTHVFIRSKSRQQKQQKLEKFFPVLGLLSGVLTNFYWKRTFQRSAFGLCRLVQIAVGRIKSTTMNI